MTNLSNLSFLGEKFVANSTKLKVSSVFFLGRLTTWSTEGEILNGQHIISLASDDLLTPAAVAAVLTFVDGLFEGRYHNRRGVYDHSLAIKVRFSDLSLGIAFSHDFNSALLLHKGPD